MFKGYWRMPEKTSEEFTHDGYFNTGDKGFVDKDGYLTIVGRTKDMIISGGLNVYPKEVESLIDGYEEVEDSVSGKHIEKLCLKQHKERYGCLPKWN